MLFLEMMMAYWCDDNGLRLDQRRLDSVRLSFTRQQPPQPRTTIDNRTSMQAANLLARAQRISAVLQGRQASGAQLDAARQELERISALAVELGGMI